MMPGAAIPSQRGAGAIARECGPSGLSALLTTIISGNLHQPGFGRPEFSFPHPRGLSTRDERVCASRPSSNLGLARADRFPRLGGTKGSRKRGNSVWGNPPDCRQGMWIKTPW